MTSRTATPPARLSKRGLREGAPTKLNKDLQGRVCAALRGGAKYSVACRLVGVSYQTFRNWMKKGEAGDGSEFVEFFYAVGRAEAELEDELVGLWRQEAARDWRAARDFLARRYPERWGKTRAAQATDD